MPINKLWSLTFILVLISFHTLFVACEKNHPPTITRITFDPTTTSAGTIYSITVEASDEDGDVLQYGWTANGGEFLSPTNTTEVLWRSPVSGEGESFSIIVNVTDGEFDITQELLMELTEAILGGVTGFVYFANCEVPIAGATVRIADKEAITDIKGQYLISDLVSGKDTLRANKQDFSPKESLVTIPPNSVLNYNVEMISVSHSTKAFGVISDQDGQAIANAQIIVLNPNDSESNLKALTDNNGLYRIQYIPHGIRWVVIRKPSSDDFKYTELRQEIEFTDIEQRFDFVIQKISLRGQFTDTRDNQEYSYKTIGNQTWMVNNLSYLPKVNPPKMLSETESHYYVYGYQGSDISKAKSLEKYRNYGALYNWQAAKWACPEGWHLPSKEEWLMLDNELQPGSAEKMKTPSGWLNNANGNNSSGFSALPAGYLTKEGKFSLIGEAAFFYISTENTSTTAWYSGILSMSLTSWPKTASKKAGFSVRCIRNE